VISAIAYVALEGWWMVDQRRRPPDERTPRFAPHPPADHGLAAAKAPV
jgi:hypothetical protein